MKIQLLKQFITLFHTLLLAIIIQAQSADQLLISKPLLIPTEKTIIYKIGEKNIPIKVIQFGEEKDIVCINLHANETTSVNAAMQVLVDKGGTLIKIENNNQRVIRFRLKGINYAFDPNRIFSREGIKQTLKENSKVSNDAIDEVEKFAQRLLNLIPDYNSCIIALHNNTDKAYSVKSYLQGNNREKDAKAVYENSTQDEDDIVFTTDSLLYQKMADAGFNSILQDNDNATKDGSLSIYCGEKKKRYINVETQHGKVGQYIIMLEKLMLTLTAETKKSPELTEDSL